MAAYGALNNPQPSEHPRWCQVIEAHNREDCARVPEPSAHPIEVADTVYDDAEAGDQVDLRCRKCGMYNTLVENTMVPRSMGAELLRRDDGTFVVNLGTGDDEAFWEAEVGNKWGCRSCVNEGENLGDVFEIVKEEA